MYKNRKIRLIILLVVCFVILIQLNSNAQKVSFNFASHVSADTIYGKSAEKFKEIVEEKSNGDIQVNLFYGGAMGGERSLIESLLTNTIEAIFIGGGFEAYFAQKYYIELPYLIKNVDHLRKVWDGKAGQIINEGIEKEYSVKPLGYVLRGPRCLTSNKMVKTAEDVKNLKLRLPEVDTWIKIWSTLGAAPTPIPGTEIYQALQLNVADAQENPLQIIYRYKFYEVQKYLILTNHLYSVYRIFASASWFNSLKPEYQKIIEEAIKESTNWANEEILKVEDNTLDELKKVGMIVIDPDIESFSEKLKDVVQEIANTRLAPGLLEEIIKAGAE